MRTTPPAGTPAATATAACRSRRASSAALALALLVLGAPAGSAEVVVLVEGEPVTRAQVATAVRLILEGEPAPPGQEAPLQSLAVRKLVEDLLIAREAAALKVGVTSAEAERAFDALGARDRTLVPRLAALGLEQALRDRLRKELLRERVLERLVGEPSLSSAELEAIADDAEPSARGELVQALALGKRQRKQQEVLRRLLESARIEERVVFAVRVCPRRP